MLMRNSFTPTARTTALRTRRLCSEDKAAQFGIIAIFVVRIGNAFGWEARRHGGVIVGRSEGRFETPDLARNAGERVSMTFDV